MYLSALGAWLSHSADVDLDNQVARKRPEVERDQSCRPTIQIAYVVSTPFIEWEKDVVQCAVETAIYSQIMRLNYSHHTVISYGRARARMLCTAAGSSNSVSLQTSLCLKFMGVIAAVFTQTYFKRWLMLWVTRRVLIYYHRKISRVCIKIIRNAVLTPTWSAES